MIPSPQTALYLQTLAPRPLLPPLFQLFYSARPAAEKPRLLSRASTVAPATALQLASQRWVMKPVWFVLGMLSWS